jgi:hypothetical protein
VIEVVAPPPTDELGVAGPTPGEAGTVVTDLGGRLLITPAPGFLGTSTFTVRARGSSATPATITIVVTGNRPPIANPDTIEVPAGVETVLTPDALLSNDVDPDGSSGARVQPLALALSSSPLELVAAYGSTGGQAWLDLDGQLHLLPSAAGTSTFFYIIADRQGSTATGTATVQSLAPLVTDPPPPTTTPTTTPSAAPTTTASTVNTPTTIGQQPTATAAPTTSVPRSTLPSTGSSPRAIVMVALMLIAIGWVAMRCRRPGLIRVATQQDRAEDERNC